MKGENGPRWKRENDRRERARGNTQVMIWLEEAMALSKQRVTMHKVIWGHLCYPRFLAIGQSKHGHCQPGKSST